MIIIVVVVLQPAQGQKQVPDQAKFSVVRSTVFMFCFVCLFLFFSHVRVLSRSPPILLGRFLHTSEATHIAVMTRQLDEFEIKFFKG